MWQTVGHDWAIQRLQNVVQRQHLTHAYLFTGPASIGKLSLALDMSAALNCPSATRPCDACPSCQRTRQRRHPDVLLVEPDQGKIKIDQIRDLQRDLALSPYMGSWRICVIRDLHLATTEASNALLKTLEEPPARVILLLTANDASLLLPTIVSRCQVFGLRAVPRETIAAALVERWHQSLERAELLARLSAGRMGWAIRACEDATLLEEREQQITELLAVMESGRAGRLKAAEALSKQENLSEVLQAWQTWWRDMVCVASGCDELVVNSDYLPTLHQLAQDYPLPKAQAAVRQAENALQQLEQNVNARLALEVLFLSWHPGSTL